MSNEVFDLRGAMGRFFNGLPPYRLTADEEVELDWGSREESRTTHKVRFPDVESAAAKAASLSPNYEVDLYAVPRRSVPQDKNGKQLLACWHFRDRRADDRFTNYGGPLGTTRMVPLKRDEPSLAFVQHYPFGELTCDAVWFFYRSRYIDEAS